MRLRGAAILAPLCSTRLKEVALMTRTIWCYAAIVVTVAAVSGRRAATVASSPPVTPAPLDQRSARMTNLRVEGWQQLKPFLGQSQGMPDARRWVPRYPLFWKPAESQ